MAQANPLFDHPLRGYGRFTSGFGFKVDPFTGRDAFHSGLDIASDLGAPVYAPANGVVVRSERLGAYGEMIEIDHGAGVRTRYGHMHFRQVQVGQSVRRGDVIGGVGSTGRSTGPHLHFEVMVDERAVDPAPLIRWIRASPLVPTAF